MQKAKPRGILGEESRLAVRRANKQGRKVFHPYVGNSCVCTPSTRVLREKGGMREEPICPFKDKEESRKKKLWKKLQKVCRSSFGDTERALVSLLSTRYLLWRHVSLSARDWTYVMAELVHVLLQSSLKKKKKEGKRKRRKRFHHTLLLSMFPNAGSERGECTYTFLDI